MLLKNFIIVETTIHPQTVIMTLIICYDDIKIQY